MERDSAPQRRPLFDLFFRYLDRRAPSDRAILYILATVFVGAIVTALLSLNAAFSTVVPNSGGTLVEGIVGTPRFVNSVLAMTRTDSDLTALIYSGLMRIDPNGELVPDLAESVTVSDDGRVYNIVLRDDIQFHDGTPIRANDVAFTIDLIQDPELKSPLRGNWTGVTVEVVDERELNLVLEDAYTPFRENLTVGIMPEHIWSPLSIEELPFSPNNTNPVGSGPYRIHDITRNKSGIIESYLLRAFTDGREQPNIDTVKFVFFRNEQELATAYEQGAIHSTAWFSKSILDTVADREDTRVIEEALPRIFTVFYNQNRSAALRDEYARRALETMVDREALVADVLDGYGVPIASPIPDGFLEETATTTDTTIDHTARLAEARRMLEAGGWEQQENGTWQMTVDDDDVTLAITLATANTDVFEQTAYYLERVWRDLGVDVSVELYEQSDLVQTVIRPRNYQALLFGTEIGRSLDLYPFWHSSQREDPGLNVALYANITTDALLETARTTADTDERDAALREFAATIEEETPALFLYSPTFTYTIRTDIEPTTMHGIARPHERFANIRDWYMERESVWPAFVQNE